MRRAAAGVFIWLVAIGAACADTPPVPLKPEDAKAPPPVPRSIWAIADNGDATHLQSGLNCEHQSGDFMRTSVYAFKPSGLDVSCNYLDHFKSLITLYLTKRGSQSLSDDFTEAKRELVYVDPKAVALGDTEQKSFASDLSWQSLIYSKQAGQLHSGIWVADLNGWTLEYRATYAPADEAAVLAEMAALTASAEKSAGAQLAVCAKAPIPVRDGTPVTITNEMKSALIFETLLGAAGQGSKPELRQIWCAEGLVANTSIPMLLWHSVFEDGTDALADRLTPATNSEPIPLSSTTKTLYSGKKDGPPVRPRWIVSVQKGNQVWQFALFDGRPSGDALAAILSDLIAGKAHSIGGYIVNGKGITINAP